MPLSCTCAKSAGRCGLLQSSLQPQLHPNCDARGIQPPQPQHYSFAQANSQRGAASGATPDLALRRSQRGNVHGSIGLEGFRRGSFTSKRAASMLAPALPCIYTTPRPTTAFHARFTQRTLPQTVRAHYTCAMPALLEGSASSVPSVNFDTAFGWCDG